MKCGTDPTKCCQGCVSNTQISSYVPTLLFQNSWGQNCTAGHLPLICPPLTPPVHNPARYSELGKAAPSSRQPLPTLCPCTCSFLSPSSALKASVRYAPLSVRSFLRHPMSKRKDCPPWLAPAALQAQHFYYSTITLFHNHFPQHECEPMAHFLFISSI